MVLMSLHIDTCNQCGTARQANSEYGGNTFSNCAVCELADTLGYEVKRANGWESAKWIKKVVRP